MVGVVTVRGPSVLLFVVEALKIEAEPAPTLNHSTAEKTVLERKLKLETVICIRVEVIILFKAMNYNVYTPMRRI